jgi:undecaprenyl-diphosphatase
MTYLQIALLAVIQGAAELLPVSSSAHVILAAKLLQVKSKPSSPEFVFLLVMLHTGTMFAVLVYFWPRWRRLLRPPGPPSLDVVPFTLRQFVLTLVIASACTAVLGLGLKLLIERGILMSLLHHDKDEAKIEKLFENLPLIAAALAAVGIFILYAGWREGKTAIPTVSLPSAVWIGLVQGLCLPFRGLSRSGATISTALLCGITRPLSEDFSFALAVILTPPLIGWRLWEVLKSADWPSDLRLIDLLLPGLVGMVLSFAAGLVALKVLSAALEKGRWIYFGYYCLFAALVVLTAALFGY